MPAPIVFISRFRVVEGRRDDWAASFAGFIDVIAESKPRTALQAAYLDRSGSETRIVHVFPDPAALTLHFEGSDERSSSISDLIEMAGFEVYGQAPDAAIDQLRREAASAGVTLDLFPDPIGGFLRAPA
jgi:hypothetical protein